MSRLVAFLKGINVGGRVVKKGTLQGVFEELGFTGVVTFRASGNVIFEAGNTNQTQVGVRIEEALRRSLGYDVAVLLRTFEQLRDIVESGPKVPVKEGSSLLVTLLPSPPSQFPLRLPMKVPKSTAAGIIMAKGREIYSLTHGGGEGALPSPFLESKLGVKATTRNMNVLREIVEKCG